jgi:uncharacterized protein
MRRNGVPDRAITRVSIAHTASQEDDDMWTLFKRWTLVAAAALAPQAHAQTTLANPPDALARECAAGHALYRAGQTRLAFRTFFSCAIAGDPASQYNAAMMMRSGESNDERFPNPHGARMFLEHAAAQGFLDAVYALAMEFDVGSPGYDRDLPLATQLFRQAALRGHVDAQVDLGTQYFLGRGGVVQSDAIAASWYERAAAAGHWGAQCLIASMYEHGHGVRRDETTALRWYEQALAGGDELAPIKVVELRLRIATRTRELRLN